MAEIGGPEGPWPLLNLRPLHRIVIIAIENHFTLAKWPPLLSVASSTSEAFDDILVCVIGNIHAIMICPVGLYFS